MMVKKKGIPSNIALPIAALVMYLITLFIFKLEILSIHASVIQGLLNASTPITIIAGAIFLFKTMELTGGIDTIKIWLNSITGNQVAQLMIVGWAFPFLIEGASGFGTPAAIAAPILVGLGYQPLKVAILTLVMNSVPVSFGAVGTPTWFGFSAIDLSEVETLEIAFKSATIHTFAAIFVVIIALIQLVEWKDIKENMLFILLSTFCTVTPYLWASSFNYEFPSLIGGACGLTISVLLANWGIGINSKKSISSNDRIKLKELFKASFPLWGTVILLVITRIPQLGIKSVLTSSLYLMQQSLGKVGDFVLTQSLSIELHNILGTATTWSYKTLYVPALIPFVMISLLTYFIYKSNFQMIITGLIITTNQMKKPIQALLGAIVFVNLMMLGGEKSAVNTIGVVLANLTGTNWTFVAAYLGAIGSFFSGSATISNLTFGAIQNSISGELGLDRTTILALQSVGGSFGNMVCINNIVAVTSILAIHNKEGHILKKTAFPMFLYGVIAALVATILY